MRACRKALPLIARRTYAKAAAIFAPLGSADAQYNLGNALAKAGRYDAAIAAYDRALKLQPKMADAIANRAAVDAARKRKPPPGKQPQQGEQDRGKQGQPAPRPGGEQGPPQDGSSASRPSPQDPAQQPAPSAQPRQPPQSPQPEDPQQQADADAAQRKRIEEALRKQKAQPGDPAAAPAKPAETAEQRERRIANQAQLQRVPDDPGGLLRARFRLEHERRQGRVP